MFGLESRLIDLQSQRMFSDQFVMGEASLGMLADHVNVLEAALDRVAFEDRRNAASIVNGIDDVHRQSNRMSRSQAEDGAPVDTASLQMSRTDSIKKARADRS